MACVYRAGLQPCNGDVTIYGGVAGMNMLYGLQSLMNLCEQALNNRRPATSLGYANRSVEDLVPANARLIFFIELIGLEKQP